MEHVSLKHSDTNQLWLDPSIVVPEEEKRFSCEICSKSFAFEESLSIHNENLHRPGTMSQVENGAKETGEKVPGVETDAIENAIIEPTEIGAKETIMAPTDIKMDSCEFDIENMDVIFDESCFDDNDLINGNIDVQLVFGLSKKIYVGAKRFENLSLILNRNYLGCFTFNMQLKTILVDGLRLPGLLSIGFFNLHFHS